MRGGGLLLLRDIFGQDHAITQLRQAQLAGRVPHVLRGRPMEAAELNRRPLHVHGAAPDRDGQ